jgi:hypothetical protein
MGCVCFAGSLAVANTGTSLLHFAGALVLLGFGWNLTYLGGTRLLVEGYTKAEAATVEGVNECMIQASGAAAAFSSAALLHSEAGWDAVAYAGWPMVALNVLGVLYLKCWRCGRRAPAGAGGDAVARDADPRFRDSMGYVRDSE